MADTVPGGLSGDVRVHGGEERDDGGFEDHVGEKQWERAASLGKVNRAALDSSRFIVLCA